MANWYHSCKLNAVSATLQYITFRAIYFLYMPYRYLLEIKRDYGSGFSKDNHVKKYFFKDWTWELLEILVNNSESFILIEVGRTAFLVPLSGFTILFLISTFNWIYSESCNLKALSALKKNCNYSSSRVVDCVFAINLWLKHSSLLQKLNLTGMTESPPPTPPVVRRSMSGAQYTVYKQVFILTVPCVVFFSCWRCTVE